MNARSVIGLIFLMWPAVFLFCMVIYGVTGLWFLYEDWSAVVASAASAAFCFICGVITLDCGVKASEQDKGL